MKWNHRIGFRFIIVLCGFGWNASTRADEFDFFESQVRPLLFDHCYKCHSEKKTGGGLSLESPSDWLKGGDSGPAIVPFDPDSSLLLEAVRYQSLEMPPQEENNRLTPAQIAVLETWIRRGAHAPERVTAKIGGMDHDAAKNWWSFQPLAAINSPLTSKQIDQQIDSQIDEHNLPHLPIADKRTLLRRVTYDLTGLPPTPDELKDFLDDSSEQAFSHVVDRLLESPQYGVHWGRHWLDVVRYADTAGENTDRPLPHAWRYRNWVFDAWNQDLPFDEFAMKQIAGRLPSHDLQAELDGEGIIATGYLAVARRFGHDIDKDMHLTYEDVIDNLGKSFLGLSLSCARCHDHKYDPVTQEDYYALYGIFASSKFSYPGCEPFGQPKDLIPLLGEEQVKTIQAKHRMEIAAFESVIGVESAQSETIAHLMNQSSRVINEQRVNEGQIVPISSNDSGNSKPISMRKGELLTITIMPNENHGADTTQIVWKIQSDLHAEQSWHSDELIDHFSKGQPTIRIRQADWLLIDRSSTPQLLRNPNQNVSNVPALVSFTNAELPSALVNQSKDSVAVWTNLPGRALFLHPGPQQNVAIGWICPEDGSYSISGSITDSHPAGLDGVSFRVEHFYEPALGREFATLSELNLRPKPVRPPDPVIPVAYGVVDGTPQNSALHLRGDPEQPKDAIDRRWLDIFGGKVLKRPDKSGREELAEWIAANPLFSRVIGNRIWQWHFGQGLVETANNFGSRGAAPTHPILLDQLASHLVSSGFSIKSLHRLILGTQAYQRCSQSGLSQQLDPNNRWLSGFSRRRLTAEEIRDSLLFAGGEINLNTATSHPFPPEREWTYTQHNPFMAVYPSNHRSAFLMVPRQQRHPYLAIFDGADPNTSTPRRQQTIVPAQSLYFLNAPFFHEQARLFSTRFSNIEDTRQRLNAMHQTVFTRDVHQEEFDLYRKHLDSHAESLETGWLGIARVLLSSNEFLYID
jgi:hypothetical protein